MPVSSQVSSEEPEELVRFREQWLAEVRSKKKAPQSQDAGSAPPAAAFEALPPPQVLLRPATIHHVQAAIHHNPPAVRRLPSSIGPAPLGPALQRAVEVYRKAVQHEQRSELDDALHLYRSAFRMDPNVDRAYQMVEDQLQAAALASAPPKTHHRMTSSAATNVDAIVEGLQNVDLAAVHAPVARTRGEGLVTGTLAKLISSWPKDLSFEAEDEQEGVPIQLLPNELLTMILRSLDHSAIERFAQVNRKARVVTLDGSIWRCVAIRVIMTPSHSSKHANIDRWYKVCSNHHKYRPRRSSRL